MKLEAFNIRHGGGSRVAKIIESIQQHDPDLVLLTEFRQNRNGEKIQSLLHGLGYLYQVSGNSEPRANTVLFASRINFESYCFFEDLGSHSHRMLSVKFSNFTLLGFYFPQKDQKNPVFDKLISEIEKESDTAVIAIGDLNTGKHYLDEKGKSFYASEYMDKLDEAAFDAWRLSHGDKREYSWYSNQGDGFRID